MTGLYIAVMFVGVVLMVMLLLTPWKRWRSARGPRIRPRRVPAIGAGASAKTASTITVAGRTYNIIDRQEGASPRHEPCPWCLRSVDSADRDAVVCRHPQCRRAAHRQCNRENDGCGGVCGVLG